MTTRSVKLGKNYFVAGDDGLLVLGAHYVPAQEALQWPFEWNPKAWDQDFRLMREMGLNMVRFDLFWAFFEPRPGVYNPDAFSQFDEILRLAKKHQLYLNPTFFIGGEVGDAYWDVPWREGRHPHADPDMMRLQVQHVEQFAQRYRGDPTIIAWDLTDEPPLWIVRTTTSEAMAANWTRSLTQALRELDPEHLITVGTAGEEIGRGPFRADIVGPEIDFLCVHPYPFYTSHLYPDPFLSHRATYSAAFEIHLARAAGKPVMVQEFGASSAQFAPKRIERYYETMMYSALGNGANGLVAWCFTDADERVWRRVPYLRHPHETQFGITDAKKNLRPAGEALARFGRVVAAMNFADLEPSAPQAGIVLPHEFTHGMDHSKYGLEEANLSIYVSAESEWAGGKVANGHWLISSCLSTFLLAKQAHFDAGFPREYASWEQFPLLLLPSPLTSTGRTIDHPHTTFWRRAQRYVESGGVIYASLCADAAIPEMADLFGAFLADRIIIGAEVELKFVQDFGDLPKGTKFSYFPSSRSSPADWGCLLELQGGEVVAVDGRGNPAIVIFARGQGRTILVSYPVERYLAQIPGAFETDELSWRLYRALRIHSGIAPRFDCDSPSVELGTLLGPHDWGYVVAVNHGSVQVKTEVFSPDPLKRVWSVPRKDRDEPVMDHHSWEIELGPFEGKVYEWQLRSG